MSSIILSLILAEKRTADNEISFFGGDFCLPMCNNVHIQEEGKFIGYLGMQYLLHIAYGSVILFLVYLFQNVVASLLTGILLAAGILQVVDALLINIIPRLKEIADFSIMNYLSSGNVGLLSMASGSSLYLKAFLIAIITLILMGSLSGLIMQKKDI